MSIIFPTLFQVNVLEKIKVNKIMYFLITNNVFLIHCILFSILNKYINRGLFRKLKGFNTFH